MENAMENAPIFEFRLYIAGDTPNSLQALNQLSALCNAHLAERHSIEIIDVFQQPERALADGIFLTPMLVKLSPLPVQRIVGTLGQRQLVLQTLGLDQGAI
jgi:circadian clock protein KaiB